ncbi:hypothetical protein HZS47_04175 [Achromobacter xylosoxidans]|nr:hypothetical protein [Achromobacter xylosoxidans]QKI78841.1 hypothetical protein HPS43_27460 [Achromobacter xylosoxidans]
MSKATFHTWKKKHADKQVSSLQPGRLATANEAQAP